MNKGTIHKRRRQFFRIFDTPLPHVGSFLVLSVGNFDQFLTPPPLPIADVVYGWPPTTYRARGRSQTMLTIRARYVGSTGNVNGVQIFPCNNKVWVSGQ